MLVKHIDLKIKHNISKLIILFLNVIQFIEYLYLQLFLQKLLKIQQNSSKIFDLN